MNHFSGMRTPIQYRGEASSLLSRGAQARKRAASRNGAAIVCSPGRKPGEDVVLKSSPVGAKDSDERSECKPDRAQPVRDERSARSAASIAIFFLLAFGCNREPEL